MKCPICGGEMQEGFLGSIHEIVWTPQPGKIKQPRNTKGAERLERNEEMPFGGCIIMWMQNDVKNAD